MMLAAALDADVAVMAQMACSLRFHGPGLTTVAIEIQSGSLPWPPAARHRAACRSPRGSRAAHAVPRKWAMRTMKVPPMVT